MPRNPRQQAQKHMAQTANHLNKAMEALAKLKRMFEEQHPELAEQLDTIGISMAMISTMLDQFSIHCWGKPPADYDYLRK